MTPKTLDLIVLALGLVLYFVPAGSPPAGKVNEIGRLSFGAALLAFLIVFRG